MLLDTHHHFDFLATAELQTAFLEELPADVRIVAQSLTPSAHLGSAAGHAALTELGLPAPVRSVGFHPWLITSHEQVDDELALMLSFLETTRFIGEVGLDFSLRRLELVPADLQREVFARILELACLAAEGWSSQGPVVMSIHAVRSAGEVLDLLAELEVCARGVVPVIHWFTGTSDELTRLVRLGGCISVNPQMLLSRRGRAYARQVPDDRLLLETDLPQAPIRVTGPDARRVGREAAHAVARGLSKVISTLTELRGPGVTDAIARNQQRLYGV